MVRRLAIAWLVAWCAIAHAQTAPKDHKLSLANGHSKLPCTACHDKGVGTPPSKGNQCKDCHARGHDTDFGSNCETCHGAIIWISVPEPMARAAHVKTPYPLLGKHQKAPCDGCHLPTTPAKDRYRLVSHDKCMSCHEDKHKGEFADKDLGDCAQCHTNDGFDSSTFGLERHKQTSFQLDGKHVATPCKSCHPTRLMFLAGGTQCLDCHQNPHGTKFALDKGCGECHSTADWHAVKTPHPSTFALTGAHARTACKDCHTKATDDPASFKGVARECKNCHDDIHAGQFDKPCDSCHTTEAWRTKFVQHSASLRDAAQPGEAGPFDQHSASLRDAARSGEAGPFDHDNTRYPLEGVHVPMPCETCHTKTTLRDGSTVVRYRLGYFQCRDCHATPHKQATFAKDLDCKSCHDATGWKTTRDPGAGFDHATTGFVLKGRHASVKCGQCHGKSDKPTRACEGCHRDPHDGRMDGACAECHEPTAWSATSVLEQHRRTRMPLTGAHAVVECNACHTRQAERTWSDLPVDCYACHQRAYHAVESPKHDGDPPLSRECQLCHTTTAWTPALSTPARTEHLSFRLDGAHQAVACDDCHVDRRRKTLVRCDGCHDAAALHATPVATAASGCLRCHPRGARR